MRVITGTARGRKLEAPKGRSTRPTTDRVKESIFNIIQFDIEGRRVLDLFAGSGQMGIECLSRGAESCVFVERNIAATGFEKCSRLIRGDAFGALSGLRGQKFGLILLDPPYGGELLNQALRQIAEIDILQTGGIIVCESAREDLIQPLEEPYRVKKQYRYGAIAITTFTREETK